ncbi:MAG: hypothetical protein ACE5H8_05810 [Alphaproteobacteria bacterium]
MKLRSLIFAAAFALVATPAFAFHCPLDMKKIDAALAAGTSLDGGSLDKVKALRAEGEKLHKTGKHKEAIETLAQAIKMLGIE